MNKIDSIFYMYSNMDGRSQILLFLIILVLLMLVSILIINFIIKRKENKYDKQFNSITRYSTAVENESKKIKKENIEKVEDQKEEIEVIEVISEDNSIENISKMIEEASNNNEIDLEKFESEEERDAIISYDELVKRAGAKKIVYKSVEQKKEEEKIEVIEMPPEKKKFKASQIVSPIYGIQKDNTIKEEIESFIDLEEFPINDSKNEQDEMTRDLEFLGSLKTFRSGLD